MRTTEPPPNLEEMYAYYQQGHSLADVARKFHYNTARRSRKRGNVGTLFIRWKPGQGDGIVWRVGSVYSAYM